MSNRVYQGSTDEAATRALWNAWLTIYVRHLPTNSEVSSFIYLLLIKYLAVINYVLQLSVVCPKALSHYQLDSLDSKFTIIRTQRSALSESSSGALSMDHLQCVGFLVCNPPNKFS